MFMGMPGGKAESFHPLTNSEISFGISSWWALPTLPLFPLEMNLFSAGLALCRVSLVCPHQWGFLISRLAITRAVPWTVWGRNNGFLGKAMFFFHFHFTSSLAHVCTRPWTTNKIVLIIVEYCGKRAGFANRVELYLKECHVFASKI